MHGHSYPSSSTDQPQELRFFEDFSFFNQSIADLIPHLSPPQDSFEVAQNQFQPLLEDLSFLDQGIVNFHPLTPPAFSQAFFPPMIPPAFSQASSLPITFYNKPYSLQNDLKDTQEQQVKNKIIELAGHLHEVIRTTLGLYNDCINLGRVLFSLALKRKTPCQKHIQKKAPQNSNHDFKSEQEEKIVVKIKELVLRFNNATPMQPDELHNALTFLAQQGASRSIQENLINAFGNNDAREIHLGEVILFLSEKILARERHNFNQVVQYFKKFMMGGHRINSPKALAVVLRAGAEKNPDIRRLKTQIEAYQHRKIRIPRVIRSALGIYFIADLLNQPRFVELDMRRSSKKKRRKQGGEDERIRQSFSTGQTLSRMTSIPAFHDFFAFQPITTLEDKSVFSHLEQQFPLERQPQGQQGLGMFSIPMPATVLEDKSVFSHLEQQFPLERQPQGRQGLGMFSIPMPPATVPTPVPRIS